MTEKPILFNDEMVRAILDGCKTQTRRPVNPIPPEYIDSLHGNKLRERAPYTLEHPETGRIVGTGFVDDNEVFYRCPFGGAGDTLWVRECWAHTNDYDGQFLMDRRKALYRSDREEMIIPSRWRPSIHMPRWASRIALTTKSVGAERLQDITEEDAIAEGVDMSVYAYEACPDCGGFGVVGFDCEHSRDCVYGCEEPRGRFAALWDSIYGKRKGHDWESNPWVWVCEFVMKGKQNGLRSKADAGSV